jgi:hypothetical protein
MIAPGFAIDSTAGVCSKRGRALSARGFIGLIGNAGLNAPLYVYVSRWFDRRRGRRWR